MINKIILLLFIFIPGITIAQDKEPWLKTEDWTPVPQIGFGENGIPADAIILFDGANLDAWQKPQISIPSDIKTIGEAISQLKSDNKGQPTKWAIQAGTLTNLKQGESVATKRAFGDCQLHIEWMSPIMEGKTGQAYSNSGIFLMGLYEVQVLNSFDNETYGNGQAGAIYKQSSPLVNASNPPGTWQTYDIIFKAPRFDENGKLKSPAFITVLHNGVLIQNHFEIKGPTLYIGKTHYFPHPEKLPLIIQDHGDIMHFRNIWVRELK